LVLDEQDEPMLATTIPVNGITEWSGTAWTKRDLAGAQAPFAVLDSTGAPMMVTTTWRITHMTGGTWLPTVPTPVPVGTAARYARITGTPDRQPVVAWQETTPAPGRI